MDGPFILKKIWTKLELRTFQLLKQKNIKERHLLVATSGGVDSLALLYTLHALSKNLRLKLTVAHIHHGPSNDKKQSLYRDKTAKFVEKAAQKLDLKFVSHRASLKSSDQPLLSEATLRKARYESLEVLRQEVGADFIALGHHREDLLETRLIRLIRGAGREGIQSMSVVKGTKLRPFLEISREDLHAYLVGLKVKWQEDPSNQDLSALRNWIRHDWLAHLESKRPGGSRALARSLEALANAPNHKWVKDYFGVKGLSRSRLLELGHVEQRQVVASFLNQRGAKNYSLAHIEEVLKRLQNPQKSLSFRCLDRDWRVDAEYIEIF